MILIITIVNRILQYLDLYVLTEEHNDQFCKMSNNIKSNEHVHIRTKN